MDEHLAEQRRGAVLGGQQHAVARPGEAAVRLVDVHAEVERGKSRHLAELLGGELIERDLIAEAALRRAARGGEEAVLGAVPAVHAGMREAAEDREVVAELGQLPRGRARVRSRARCSAERTASAARRGCSRSAASAAASATGRTRTNTGVMHSSNGNASVTPAPRRKRRRETLIDDVVAEWRFNGDG